jgi:retron-type reverse transcriptase
LTYVSQSLKDTNWFIEGDIKGCFDNIDHEILMEIMEEKVKDGRFLQLTKNLLKAGYMENWTNYDTNSGTPQGGIISPLLTNIYLDKFDKWVEKELLPRYNHSRMKRGGRQKNPEYFALYGKMKRAKKKGNMQAKEEYRKMMKATSSVMTNDPDYRKLEYIRYADDFMFSFAGPKHEAKTIQKEIREYLVGKLKLELSEEKNSDNPRQNPNG